MRLLRWLALGAITLGCGRIERTSECRALTRTINEGLDDIELLADASPPELAELANRYAALAKRVRGLSFSGASVEKAAADYATLLEDTALALAPSRPLPGPDAGRILRPVLANVIKRERPLVGRIEGLCQSP